MRAAAIAFAIWAIGSGPAIAESVGATPAECLAAIDLTVLPVQRFAPGRCATNAVQLCRNEHGELHCMAVAAVDLSDHFEDVRRHMPANPVLDTEATDGLLGGVNLGAISYESHLLAADDAFATDDACKTLNIDTDDQRCRMLLSIQGITSLYDAINSGKIEIPE